MGKIVALGGGRFDNGEMDNVTEHIISLTGKKNPHFLLTNQQPLCYTLFAKNPERKPLPAKDLAYEALR